MNNTYYNMNKNDEIKSDWNYLDMKRDMRKHVGDTAHRHYGKFSRDVSKRVGKKPGDYVDYISDEIDGVTKNNPWKNESINMNKKLIRLTESDLHKIVKESVQKVLKEGMRTISIAPRPDEIEVTDMEISTTWNGGIRYTGNIAALRQKYGDDNLRSAFQQAIGMSSKPWQMERLLNNYFKINGKVS